MSDLFTDPAPDPEHLDRLRAGLARRMGEGDLDVAYCTVDSPVGRLLVAATDRGAVRVAFDREDFDAVLDDLAARVGARILRAPARLDGVARELDGYFAGRLHEFTVPLDRRLSQGFRAEVQAALRTIPYGSSVSYAEVAALVDRPTAVRAVGTACATNPLPILQPCHRVVRSDGSVGNYLGGTEVKARLLALEASAGRSG